MAENSHPPQDLLNAGPGHEHTDVNAWAVGRFGIALVLLCIVTLGLLLGLFRYFESAVGGPATRVEAPARLPAAPTLETTPVQDLRAIRAQEEQVLSTYGWVDQQKGIVRIPIARAIDLLAQRGLPSRPQNEVQTSARDVSVPTESGLGPKMQPPGGPLSGELK
jgi:hypothetical protein